MGKRVYEFAKEQNVTSKQVITQLEKMNKPVKNHMAVLDEESVKQLDRVFNPEKYRAADKQEKPAATKPAETKSAESKPADAKPAAKQEAPKARPQASGGQSNQAGNRGGNRFGNNRNETATKSAVVNSKASLRKQPCH
ncbi:translation initiation factor IF-2 N-terminal domain-containing protein [Exiguobacterium chiriqhucha]|uniref:translation initiation factor IF-2 N-terminal domain-containing protein n=1 Tax=Exiguobacterium chiriqhucha TaxID=1385984 RepID=UPI0023F1B983|nr:translation initiation factor IF-2 N-terminal domain-containing protein [Exiguobacterium chiriqhucha]